MIKAFITLSAIFIIYTAEAQKTETLDNKAIIAMSKAGLGNDIIIAKIRSSVCRFDLNTNGLVGLKNQKVPDDVISIMMEKGDSTTQPAISRASGKTDSTKNAGAVTQVPDLEFINVPHYYDKGTKGMKVLERSTVAVKAKVNLLKAMVPGTSTPIVFRMANDSSSARIPLQESVSFMVNTGTNVPEIFGLYKMEVLSKKNMREATWFNISAFDNKSDKDVIAFNYKKVKDGVYEIVPVSKLEKGEYCFVNKLSYSTYGGAKADVFAFGVE